MYCPKCNYLLDITKTIEKGAEDDTIITPLNMNQFINLALSDKEIDDNHTVTFSINDLSNNPKFKKMDKESQKFIITRYDELKNASTGRHSAFFQCNSCGYSKAIKPGTLLFNRSYVIEDIVEDPRMKTIDPTLPRTKDYVCRNDKCESHKNLDLKEAVFFRKKNSFQLTYVCCLCETAWLVV